MKATDATENVRSKACATGNRAPLSNANRFFELAVGDNAAERYSGFAKRLPQGWRVWYMGVHPGRIGSPVRVDCFVDPALKEAYAADSALLERDLRAGGAIVVQSSHEARMHAFA